MQKSPIQSKTGLYNTLTESMSNCWNKPSLDVNLLAIIVLQAKKCYCWLGKLIRSLVGIVANMSWHVVMTCHLLPFLANMGDTQTLWQNELCLQHVTNCHVSSSTLLGDVFCHLFLLCVVTQQKSMLTWCHIRHVGNMSQNAPCC